MRSQQTEATTGKEVIYEESSYRYQKMITGGVERALNAMLQRFDYSTTEVDLYVESLGGELFDELPKEVNCFQLPTIHKADAFKHPLLAAKKLNALRKLSLERHPYIEQCWLSSQMLMPINKMYDVAISYHAPNTVPVFYVVDSMRANRKILWLHGDLETNGGDTELALHYHSQYDHVFAVSLCAQRSFVRFHPEMSQRVSVFHNFIDAENIRRQSETGPVFSDEFDGIRLLSIGRLDSQKGFDLAVLSCKALIDMGYNIRWYICGEGAYRATLESMIYENGLCGRFVLLGNQKNPYGYLKKCDLYVQTSTSEGWCMTTQEARILHKPCVVTDIPVMHEQFTDGINGIIAKGTDAAALYAGIMRLLTSPELTERMIENLKAEPQDGAVEIQKLYDFLES